MRSTVSMSAALLALLLAAGCEKKSDPSAAPAPAASAASAAAADFQSLSPEAWVNGPAFSLSAARGKNVVLVEAWHRL
jgi:predicted outer membrane protein